METIGNRLCAAREGRALSIEDAAHQTRIQAIYLRGLENDDYSSFPSTTYAKSFLTLYSRFLAVDAEDALQQFAGGDAISLSGQGYLESVTDNIEPRRPSSIYADNRASRPSAPRRSRETSPGMAPLFLGVVLLLLVIAIPTLWILGKDAQSFDEVADKAKDLTNATFSTSDPKSDKGELQPAGDVPEETTKTGPPVPAPKPASASASASASEQKPVQAPSIPKETRVAQVTPPNGTDRVLKTQPGVKSSVITGQKSPESESGTLPLRAIPSAGDPIVPKPEAPQSPPPASVPNGGQPLRAVPLIARPVVIPEEGAAEEGAVEEGAVEEGAAEEVPGVESVEEDGNTDPEENGNRFPRRTE